MESREVASEDLPFFPYVFQVFFFSYKFSSFEFRLESVEKGEGVPFPLEIEIRIRN